MGELRTFGLVVGTMVMVVFGGIYPWLLEAAIPWWPWAVGGALVTLSLICPQSLKGVHKLWMRASDVIGATTNRLVLGLVFCMIIVPVGLAMHLLKRDPLARRIDPDALSYRVRSVVRDPNNMQRPF